MADSRPRVDPANMARMDQAADFAVDGARVSVDDKDGFVGWANQVCAEQAGARDGAIGGAPFGKMAVQRFTNARYDVDFSCFQLNSLLVESTAAEECQPVLTCFQVEEEDVALVGGRCVQVVAVRRGRRVEDDVADV